MRERIIQQVARAPEGVCPQCGTDYSSAYPSPDDIVNQILKEISKEIEKVGNEFSKTWDENRWADFEVCRQRILAIFKEDYGNNSNSRERDTI